MEEWAARCISKALRAEVEEHDDGSAPGMYDLRIVFPDREPGAVEVTAAADQQSIQIGKLVYDGERWIIPDIAGGWIAGVIPTASMKRLRVDLPALLQSLESQGIREPRPDLWWEPGPHKGALRALGVAYLSQGETDHAGSIYLMVEQDQERTAGVSPLDGQPLLDWLADWLARPDKADNLAKLKASNADERHLFLILPEFADAPFGVVDLLMRDDSPLPDADPNLPPDITHIWVLSTWNFGNTGVRWAPGAGWSRFAKDN